CAGCGAPPLRRSRVVERRPGVMPPKPGPPPRQVPRQRIVRRRALAVGGLVLVLAVVFALVKIASGGSGQSAPTTTAIVFEKQFRVIFPEGMSRAEMAHRVQVVAKIAERKRHHRVRLSARTYLAASHPRRLAGFGATTRSLEGFLFPATYDFVKSTTSTQLVHSQLSAFADNWSKVDLKYARS